MEHTIIIRHADAFRQAVESMNANEHITLCLTQDIELKGSTILLKTGTSLTIKSSDETTVRTIYINLDNNRQIFLAAPAESQVSIHLDHIALDGRKETSPKGCGQLFSLPPESHLVLSGNGTSMIRNFLLGKGAGLIPVGNNSRLELDGLAFSDNNMADTLGFASRKGTLLHLCRDSNAVITGCSFIRNGTGCRLGGVLYGERIGHLHISDTVFCENTANRDRCSGGAIFIEIARKVTIHDCLFHTNYAAAGAALYIEFSDVTIARTTVSGHNNTVDCVSAYGAVLLCGKGSKQISDSSFSENGKAGKVARAGALYAAGQTIVNNCTFKDNIADKGCDILWISVDPKDDRLTLSGTRPVDIALKWENDRTRVFFTD